MCEQYYKRKSKKTCTRWRETKLPRNSTNIIYIQLISAILGHSILYAGFVNTHRFSKYDLSFTSLCFIMKILKNSSVEENTTNVAHLDPFQDQRHVYIILAIIMGVSITLNVTAIIILTRDTYLRKRSQYLVFTIISVSEILNDVLYLILLFVRHYGIHECMMILFIYTINRHNVFIHLLYLCIERFCALRVSFRNFFMKLIAVKTRLIFLCCSILVTSFVFIPIFILYSKKDINGCGVITLFGTKATLVFNMTRIIFSVETILISVLYFYISKKIQVLVSVNVATVSSGMNDPQTTDRREARRSGDKWKLKAFYILRTYVIVTVILSLPMVVFQILSFIIPSTYMDPKVNVALSASNVLHAILLPFVFIVQLKKRRQTTN